MSSIHHANALRKRWQQGETTLNSWLAIANTFSAEIMAQADFDSLTIDLQHGYIDYSQMSQMLPALTHLPTLVRIPWLDAQAMKVLDAGVSGIICPMINTAEQAQQLVQFTRYPPIGERSFGPIRANVYQPDYHSHANQSVLVFAMIETEQAVANVEAILATEYLDGIYIGPSDLACSHNYPPGFDRQEEHLQSIIKNILQLAKKYNKFAGIHNGTMDYTLKMADWGFDFVTVGSDARFINQLAQETANAFKKQQQNNSNQGY